VAIVRGTRDDYRTRLPTPEDVALLVEAAESSLAIDRGPKCSAFARAGIPVYWIINLVDRQVEVYSNPAPDGYRLRQVFLPGSDIPVVIAGIEVGRIAAADLLP
jgi:Uma2 family endonuclease